MVWSIVQSQAQSGTGSVTNTFPSTATIGHLLLILTTCAGFPSWSAPSGWTQVVAGERSGNNMGLQICYKVSAGTETAVTVASGGATNTYFQEWSGNAAAGSVFDVATGIASSTGVSPATSLTVGSTPGPNGALVMSLIGATVAPTAVSGGFTMAEGVLVGSHATGVAYLTGGAASTLYTATWTVSGGNSVLAAASFKSTATPSILRPFVASQAVQRGATR